MLTRGWRDAPEGLRLSYWLATPRGPLEVEIEGERAVMFVAREVEAEADGRRAVDLTTLWGQPVDALYFTQQRRMVDVARAIRERGHPTCESDVKPADRYLMERFITGPCRVTGAIRRRGRFLYANNPTLRPAEHRPQLTSLSLDIETDGFGGPIISIALVDDTG
ncbi:MAG: hypothetical protein KC583_15640, partial [Myxococcales bacterium]|nr:hypothetical protein [Myxococcales bacterium]